MSAALYMAPSGAWTLGVKIGLPILALVAATALILAVLFLRGALRDTLDPIGWWVAFGFAAVIAIGAVTGGIFAFWPFNSAYHQYRDVSGTVRQISSRFVSAGDQGGTNQKFIVVLNGSQQPFGIEDTRAALLHRGDPVHLRCIRVWDYGSTNAGYDCKWGAA